MRGFLLREVGGRLRSPLCENLNRRGKVKVRILKDIVSVHGTFRKGQVVNLPAGVAAVWLTKDGVIREETGPGKPSVIPEGMFWCEKHETLHKSDSSTGKKCLRRIEAERKEAEEAEEKARLEEEETAEAAAEAKAKAKAKAEAQATIKEAVEKAELPEASKEMLLERFQDAESADGIEEAIKVEEEAQAEEGEE